MDWMREIDGYCERLGPGYWAEPINAVTNLAFVVMALIIWRRVPDGAGLAQGMVVILGLIGLGSYLFHTHAQVWAAMADTLPILAFILVYIFAAHRGIWGMRFWPSLAWTAGFIPYAIVMVPIFQMVPGLGSSAGYAPVPLLIALHAIALRRRAPETARGFAIGAGLLTLSITFRALDEPLCGLLPFGTHFLWHLFNAVMLAWMIEVYVRHLKRRN